MPLNFKKLFKDLEACDFFTGEVERIDELFSRGTPYHKVYYAHAPVVHALRKLEPGQIKRIEAFMTKHSGPDDYMDRRGVQLYHEKTERRAEVMSNFQDMIERLGEEDYYDMMMFAEMVYFDVYHREEQHRRIRQWMQTTPTAMTAKRGQNLCYYLILSGEDEKMYKVGITNNIKSRIRQIEKSSGYEVEVVRLWLFDTKKESEDFEWCVHSMCYQLGCDYHPSKHFPGYSECFHSDPLGLDGC